jgi:DNA-binding transcriptional MerR regulator
VAKRLYYRIGQACKQLDIQPYVLRYWETEFAPLSPDKSKSGQRVYTEQDLEIIRRIKELLYDEGFTIAGAKKRLDAELESGGPRTRQAGAVADAAVDDSVEETAEPDDSAAGEAPAPELDTAATQQVETLRQAMGEALDRAREILALLDEEPANDDE